MVPALLSIPAAYLLTPRLPLTQAAPHSIWPPVLESDCIQDPAGLLGLAGLAVDTVTASQVPLTRREALPAILRGPGRRP